MERLLTPLRMGTRDKLDFIKVGDGYLLRQWHTFASQDEVYITRAELAELIRVALDDFFGTS